MTSLQRIVEQGATVQVTWKDAPPSEPWPLEWLAVHWRDPHTDELPEGIASGVLRPPAPDRIEYQDAGEDSRVHSFPVVGLEIDDMDYRFLIDSDGGAIESISFGPVWQPNHFAYLEKWKRLRPHPEGIPEGAWSLAREPVPA